MWVKDSRKAMSLHQGIIISGALNGAVCDRKNPFGISGEGEGAEADPGDVYSADFNKILISGD